VNTQTEPVPVSDEGSLEQLEAEFLRNPSVSAVPSELDLAEMLAPAIGRVDVDPVCGRTHIRSRYGGCCG
jgi:hypothetical protein